MEENGVEILHEDDEALRVKYEGHEYDLKVKNLGWYEPEKILSRHLEVKSDKRDPNVTGIVMDFAEVDLELLRKGIAEYKLDGQVVPLSPDNLKLIPAPVKDLVTKKAAPNMGREREKLKNFVRS